MPKTFNPDDYKIENKNEDSLFKDFRDELVSDLEGGFSAISTDLDGLYTQIGQIEIPEVPEIPEVTPAEEQTVTFTEAETKENIAAGENIKTLFGKVAKWFSSFGILAWKSKVGTDDIDNGAIIDNKLAPMSNGTIKGFFSTDENTTLGTPYDLNKQTLKDMLGYLTTEDMSGYASTDHTHTAVEVGALPASTEIISKEYVDGKPTIYVSTEKPTDASEGKDGDIWVVYDESDGEV